MTSHTPLPPHLEQFVREQLASGRFQSESEVIRAALQLLEAHSPPHSASGTWRKPRTDDGPRNRPAGPAGEPVRGFEAPGSGAARPARRSPRGLLADLRSDISPDEIREARSELWSGFPRGTP